MKDIRIVNSDDLSWLNKTAIRHDFNRAVQPDWLRASLDPEGNHVLSMVLYGHNMDFAPILHHRALVLAKITGQEDAEEFYLDIADEDWKRLKTAEEVREELGLPIS